MVSYEDCLPLKWQPGTAEDLHSASERDRSNQFVLESAAAVEDRLADSHPEEYSEIHQELRRLDAKMHVLMEMVARLLRDDGSFAGRRPVRIALKSIKFRADTPEAPVGQAGVLQLQIHPAVPAPLVIAGAITDQFEDEGARWVCFEPDHLSEPLRDALSRHVFRHHRRQVAARRRSTPPRQDS